VNAVACPDCGAKQGELCRRPLLCETPQCERRGTCVLPDGSRLCNECARYFGLRDYVSGSAYEPLTQMGRPIVCGGRRSAWRMVREGEGA
jgi:hypothetical protein